MNLHRYVANIGDGIFGHEDIFVMVYELQGQKPPALADGVFTYGQVLNPAHHALRTYPHNPPGHIHRQAGQTEPQGENLVFQWFSAWSLPGKLISAYFAFISL
jgi:hypothetical protein